MTANEITTRIKQIKDELYDLGVQIQKIDKKSGEELIASALSIGVNALGIKVQIPKQFAYMSLGIFGIALSYVKVRKLRPLAQRVTVLEKEYNELVNEYEKIQADKEIQVIDAKIVTASNTNNSSGYGNSATTQTQNTNTNSNNILYGALGLLGFVIISNRKNTKK